MPTTCAPASGRRDDGFSLIELVVAMVVLGSMSLAVIGIILNTQSLGVNNRARVAAANLAGREVDILREEFTRTSDSPMNIANAGTVTNPHPLPSQTAGQPLRVDGGLYTVKRSVAWNITGEGASACDGGSLVMYPTLRVTVTVTWSGMGNIAPVVTTASLAPRKDDKVLGTSSYIAVKVSDASGLPNSGRNVRVYSSGESRTAVTDASGCAVAQVTPASGAGTSYSAQVTDVGFVDVSGATGPTKIVGIVPRGALNNSVTFTYARAATLTLQLVDSTGAPANPADLVGGTVTLNAAEYAGASGTTVLPVTGPTMTLTGLWPTQYSAYWGSAPPTPPNLAVALTSGSAGTIAVAIPVGTP
ncbi:hypothetical protein ASE38_13990 [Cellulomonas sp. Root930]|nr:hypothetical protein ASE38_13990 [Cellulomonas sp. Root930]